MSETKSASKTSGDHAPVTDASKGVRQLSAQELQVLKEWLSSVPEDSYPSVLLSDFPHILTGLQAQWHAPEELHQAFQDVALNDRGARQGLPLAAMTELHKLWDYYFMVKNPKARKLLEPKQGINPYLISNR